MSETLARVGSGRGRQNNAFRSGKSPKTGLRSPSDEAEARSQMLLAAMLAFRDGDFSWRLPSDWGGAEGRIAEAFNQSIAHEDRISREVERLSVTVGRDDATAADDYLMGAPEVVIEVLSPSNTVDEINDKMLICMSNGCNSFWIVDPKRQLVSVTQGAVTTLHGHAEDVEQIPVRSSKLILQPAYGGSPRAARRVPTPGLINQVDREAAAQEERTHAPLGDAVSEFFYSSRRASIGCSRAARQAGP